MKKAAAVMALACFLSLCAGGGSSAATPSDYANPGNWMSVPSKADKTIDVFYLYPSAWDGAGGQTYANIDNVQMRTAARQILEKTRGMFDQIANIYAPYYRQSNAAATLGMSLDDVEALTRAVPGEDALAAFKYYLENYNQGRPFILASHSQGSSTMKVSILGELVAQDPALLSRMIAAYTIGWTYTADYLAARGLQFAQGPDDTGVIIAWNTEAPGVTANNPVVYPGALVINPITWTTSDEHAPASESLGSSIPGYEGSDGQIDPNRGVVINTTLDPAGYDLSPMFPYGSFHSVEWELYFYDVFQNVITRSVSHYSPTYARYSASLGNGELGDFTRYLRGLLDQNPNPGTVFFHPVHSIFFKLSSQPNTEAFKAEARKVYSSLTPQAAGQAIINLSHIDRAAAGVLKRQLGFGTSTTGLVPVSAGSPGWSVWAQPFYHSGAQKGDSLRAEIHADYTGLSAGVVKRAGNYAFGLGFHAGRGDLDGSRYTADVEGLGFGAGVSRRFWPGEVFSPEIALTGGYSSYSLEQTRIIRGDVFPEGAEAYESEPSVKIWNAAIFAGNDFPVSNSLSLRPEFGFDYLSATMKSYRESGGELALNVDPKRHESFRSAAGLVLNWRPIDRLRLLAGGHWRHEFADKNVSMRSAIRNLDTFSFSAEGRNLGRDSGTASLRLEWTLPAPLEMGLSLDYMRTFSKTYSSNEISASFAVHF